MMITRTTIPLIIIIITIAAAISTTSTSVDISINVILMAIVIIAHVFFRPRKTASIVGEHGRGSRSPARLKAD